MRAALWSTCLLLSACSRGDGAPTGSRERGRVLFQQHCTLCHGARADGRGERAFAFTRPPADFTSVTWRTGTSVARVLLVLREGVRGTAMSAWPSLRSDEMNDLAAYVLSVAGDGP